MPTRRPRLIAVTRAVHVIVSIGWIGAVAVFLGIAILGSSSVDARLYAGIYAALAVSVWTAIVPLAILALVSGVTLSLITPWGLLRHYWVVFKLVLTTGATLLLLVHTSVVDAAASSASRDAAHVLQFRLQLVVDSALALGVLAGITVLAYVKPRGLTPWAKR
ncbi:hypothetical protein JNB63_16935 [Microbacterium trichothecenolyticum]|uniref:DUF2269 domain-containing protein n=1 Tax=Microbacterium ureisolvens TaxID=2781186 RepID=A0ABS7I2J7_9MICO|nr:MULTISPECIES: hypothetical protein [Microbacterium]MBW9111543.1 hypothetical protein [Microbacterium ureisolvens]MBW9121785.1 hypothetical protein [Microbacterium trichothecenolyticum]